MDLIHSLLVKSDKTQNSKNTVKKTKTVSHNPQKVFFYILFTLVESRFLFKNPPLAMIFFLKTVFYEILTIDGTNLLVLPFL
jgi:hypothetical protein